MEGEIVPIIKKGKGNKVEEYRGNVSNQNVGIPNVINTNVGNLDAPV